MRISKYVLVSVILLSTVFASSRIAFHHDIPQGIVRGENVTFELMMPSNANGLYDMHLFYRQLGEGEYSFVRMEREGFLYQVTLGTENFTVGQVEYYFAYEGRLGEIGSLPQESPEQNPFVMHVAPARVNAQEYSVEVVILSPEPDEVVRGDELVIAASILGTDTEFDVSKTKLMIDGKNVTNLAEINDGVLTFSPPKIVGGFHNVELIVFDSGNAQVGKQEWSFRATGGPQQGVGGSNYKGSFFLEDRNQDVKSSGFSNNYFRAGVQVAGNVDAFDWRTRLIYSSEESDNRQPVNRYGVHGRYKFSERNNIYLRGGDFTPFYSPLTFQSKRVRGIGAGLEYGFFTFDFIWGQLSRSIEGKLREEQFISGTDTSIVDVAFGGTYAKNILALRPGFRFGENVHWHLNLLNSKEDDNSIKFGGNVKEALVVGTDLNMNFDNKRILFDASFQASIGNANATGENIPFDSVAARYSGVKDFESAFNFLESSGFLSITEGLTPFPSLAMRFATTLRYFNNNLQVRYLRVDENFRSPGNPYMLKDVSGLYIIDNFRLLKNQIFVNLFYKAFTNSRSKGNFATDNNEIGASISYFPLENIPSLTVSFSNISRSNKVTEADNEDYDTPLLFKEDNTTSSITVSSSYNVDMSSIRNTLSLSFTNYTRDESAELRKESNSDFSVFSAGVKSRFDFPLTAKVNYSTSSSAFGDTSQSKNDISRINFGLEYLFRDVLGGGNLKPFAFFTFQNIKTDTPLGDFDTSRNNYTFGLSYRSGEYGTLSIRYDSISYSELDVSDSILNAKYQYNF